ncbi:MAG: hypothetical protein DRJ03_02035 [Chloroflexi bacterium]|nr:MAG: hypothetical protein DRJ03_02035 [Chloroflexota bacterium]
MYDAEMLRDALDGWCAEHKDDMTKGLDELMRLVKQVFERGAKVRHEDRVVGEVTKVSDRKVVMRFVYSEEEKDAQKRMLEGLGVLPSFCDVKEETEMHYDIAEVEPTNDAPGVVSVRVNTTGIPVRFNAMTDSGSHLRTLKHAEYLLRGILANNEPGIKHVQGVQTGRLTVTKTEVNTDNLAKCMVPVYRFYLVNDEALEQMREHPKNARELVGKDASRFYGDISFRSTSDSSVWAGVSADFWGDNVFNEKSNVAADVFGVFNGERHLVVLADDALLWAAKCLIILSWTVVVDVQRVHVQHVEWEAAGVLDERKAAGEHARFGMIFRTTRVEEKNEN